MFGRKILFLAAGYVAGNVVSSLYNSKKGKEVQADIKKAKKQGNESEVFISHILETQKNLFSDLGKMIPKEHKKTFESKKQELLDIFTNLKQQGAQVLKDIEQTSSQQVAQWAKKVSSTAKKLSDTAEEIEKKVKK